MGGNAIWLTDKDLHLWQPGNPIDYADWFYSVMAQAFFEEQARVAKRMDIADVPAWQVRTALQRTVQALKRHRDMHFAKSPKDKPASIIITTLAARGYAGVLPLRGACHVTAKMPGLVEVRTGNYWVANPVHPEENFANRWRRHPGRDRPSSSGWSRFGPTSLATAPTWARASTACSRRSPRRSASALPSVPESISGPPGRERGKRAASAWPPAPACLPPLLPCARTGRCRSTRTTARYRSAVASSSVRQAFVLDGVFPKAKTKLTTTRFTWVSTLQPTELSRVYTVRIVLHAER